MCTNRPPKGDRSKEFWFCCRKNMIFDFLPNNLIFGLSEIVEGTFLKFPIFRQNFEFSNFRADFPLLRSYLGRTAYIFSWKLQIDVFWTYTLGVWTYIAVFWVSELILWVSELILWVSELISLVLGVWTYTLGIRGPSILVWPVNLEILKDQAFWYDSWIWKYGRTKHSGMWPSFLKTCPLASPSIFESGNIEGPSILVWPAPLLDKQGGGSGGR